MARQKGSRTGRCQGCNHIERVRIERLLAAGASIKGTARKFEIDYHALRRHWINHVSAEARATYIAGAGLVKDQPEEVVADESLAMIDHYRIVRGALYKGMSAASEVGDNNALGLLAGGCMKISAIAADSLVSCSAGRASEQRTGQSRLYASDCSDRECGGAISGSTTSGDRSVA